MRGPVRADFLKIEISGGREKCLTCFSAPHPLALGVTTPIAFSEAFGFQCIRPTGARPLDNGTAGRVPFMCILL